MRLNRLAAFSAGLVVLLTAGGCGSSTTKVTGKVTYNGKPVTWGNVTLIAGDGMAFYGELGPDGTFSIDKVPTGPLKIGVTSPKPVVADQPAAGGGGVKNDMGGMTRGDRGKKATAEQAQAWFAIPEKYSDPNSSGLTEMASSGKPLVIDLK